MDGAIIENTGQPSLHRPVKCKNQTVNGRAKSGGSNNGTGNPGKSVNDATSSIALAKLPQLTIKDVTCPICWSILYEPTTLPCNHSLCIACYLKHAEETSLYCPCCRRRLSIWSRKAKKHNELLDKDLWIRLKNEFSEIIAARENDDNYILPEDDLMSQSIVRDGVICDTPGAIFSELKEVLKPHEEDLEKERLEAELASINFIKKLADEEFQVLANHNKTEQDDFLLAKKLQEEFVDETRNEKEMQTEPRKSARKKTPCRNLIMTDFYIHEPYIRSKSQARKKSLSSSKKQKTKMNFRGRRQSNADRVTSASIGKQEMTNTQDSPTADTMKSESSDCLTSSFTDSAPEEQLSNANRHEQTLLTFANVESMDKIEECIADIISETTAKPPLHSPTSTKGFDPAISVSDDEMIPSSDTEADGWEEALQFSADFGLLGNVPVHTDGNESDTIDYETLTKEASDLAAYRQKLVQEAEDKAVAIALQRNINLGIDESRGRDSEHKYSIRAWKRSQTTKNE